MAISDDVRKSLSSDFLGRCFLEKPEKMIDLARNHLSSKKFIVTSCEKGSLRVINPKNPKDDSNVKYAKVGFRGVVLYVE